MLRIRLSRTGGKKQASYRIVVADIEAKRDGRVVERIGHYNPRTEPLEYRIKEDRALYWLSVGAQPSDPVRRLLVRQGTLERLTRLHKGEALEDLVAEFEGKPAGARKEKKGAVAAAVAETTEAVATAVEPVSEVVEEVTDDAAAETAEVVAAPVEPVAAAVEEVAEAAADTVADVVEAVEEAVAADEEE
ncbi:MAG: 30S ribosomal protein S16 [Chloroflexi bacterium]|nr:30S ribosomal protein S16 [Chloroflexota bacterium]MCI0579240.1 30S ribosomal protein S16 [Chloroflexota bacterium]MCI0647097.1 30S ribosomal protein S16 [Chloroflexota bacterium]MCI0725871.1 30S ribosomal protein S16 [Chloroflexota bacterium]